jgi:hypothetical protein
MPSKKAAVDAKKASKQIEKEHGEFTDRGVLMDQVHTTTANAYGPDKYKANFPAQYFDKSKWEDKWQAWQAAIGTFTKDAGDYDPVAEPNKMWKRPEMPKEFVSMLEKKRQQEELMAIEQWLYKTFDLSNPLVVRYVNELYPDYLQRRQEQLEKDIDIMKRLAMIRLQGGPRSKDDLLLKYMVDQGIVKVDNLRYTIWEPDSLTNNASTALRAQGAYIKRGVFNPRSYRGVDLKTGDHSGHGDWLKAPVGIDGLRGNKVAGFGFGLAKNNASGAAANWG